MPRDDLERVAHLNDIRFRLPGVMANIRRNTFDMRAAARDLAGFVWPDDEPQSVTSLPDLLSMSTEHLSRDNYGTFAQALTDEFSRRQAEEDAKRAAAAEEAAGQAEQKAASTGGASVFASDEETALARDTRYGIGDGAGLDPTALDALIAGEPPGAPPPETGPAAAGNAPVHTVKEDEAGPQPEPEPPPTLDAGAALDFLGRFLRGEPVLLVAINPFPPSKPKVRYFKTRDGIADQLREWTGRKLNIYFTVNRTLGTKRKKGDITAARAFYADYDPKSPEGIEAWRAGIEEKLHAFVPPPSCIVSSGRGVQAFWLLREPIPVGASNIGKLEACNEALADALGGDDCQSIEHVMRLPGTVNVAGPTKLDKGFAPYSQAKLFHMDETRLYEPADFEHLLPKADSGAQEEGAGVAGSGQEHEEMPHLDSLEDIEALRGEDEQTGKLRKLIETGDLTLRLDPKRGGEPYPSRSEAGFAVILTLLALGVPAAVIIAVFLNARWAVGAYVRDKANASAAVETEIKRAQKKTGGTAGADASSKDFVMRPDGLWLEGKAAIWLCSPLEVLGEIRGEGGFSWGLYLRWRDPEGHLHHWTMPRKLLAGDGVFVREELLDGGLKLGPDRGTRELFNRFLMTVSPKTLVRCVTTTGWHSGCYVMPDTVIGSAGGELIVLQTVHPLSADFDQKGTLEDWQRDVARLCIGNSRLMFCVSLAFAAAIFGLLGAEGGGFHLVGPSSIGKTTALVVANSVWRQRIGSWRTTDNALEGTAAEHNDGFLALDELSEVDARTAGLTAYMLANGKGKGRADRRGAPRQRTQWRLLYLSTGEQSLAEKVKESSWQRLPRAGQAVRFVEIPADAGAGGGLFEMLHWLPSAQALADHLKEAVRKQHGTAARVFIEGVAADPDRAKNFMKATIKEITEEACSPDADGRVRRVVTRFALVAAAGELAIRLGIVPWPRNAASTAAGVCFQAWLAARGSAGPQEIEDAIRQVLAGLSAHGSSRFEDFPMATVAGDPVTETAGAPVAPRVVNRLGWRRRNASGDWEYLVTPPGFAELAQGYSVETTAKAMAERGLLIPASDGRHLQVQLTVPGYGRQRLYLIPTAGLTRTG
jgi:uncharacterized protein (DUF927 family)